MFKLFKSRPAHVEAPVQRMSQPAGDEGADEPGREELPPHRGEVLLTHQQAIEASAFDDGAMKIIESSEFTTHNRYGTHRAVRAANIINDFFRPDQFRNATILELGPGHFGFALLARRLGATVICAEKYQPHVELGRHLGFKVLDVDFLAMTPEAVEQPVDGLWMKGAFNACRFATDDEVSRVVQSFTRLLSPKGWGWCVTVNKAAQLPDGEREVFEQRRIELQKQAFLDCGWEVWPIDEADRKRYALTYAGARYYFTRNLDFIAGRPKSELRPATAGTASAIITGPSRERPTTREQAVREVEVDEKPLCGERIISQLEATRVASLDDRAIALVTRTTQYGPRRGARVSNIINDQFERSHFEGRTILELGPGHFSFALLARHLGAMVICVDRNPVLVELGRYLGFHMLDIDFYKLTPEVVGSTVDGLWLKGAFNACQHGNEGTVIAFVDRLTKLISPSGWGWAVTTNQADTRREGAFDESTVQHFEQQRIEVQRDAFLQHGWTATPIPDDHRARYSIKHRGGLYYFTRNLPDAPGGVSRQA